MICPHCKVEMNHHAVKVDYTRPDARTRPTDRAFGGILEEFHACPQCGATATREAEHKTA